MTVIENNTETAYRDYFGEDGAVEQLPSQIVTTHIWMPPARTMWAFDQRIACGFVAANPAAILLCTQQLTSGLYTNTEISGDFVVAEGGAAHCTLLVNKVGSTLSEDHYLDFYLWDGTRIHANPSPTDGFFWLSRLKVWDHTAPTDPSKCLTLQDVVDHINFRGANLFSGATGPWANATNLEVSHPINLYGAIGSVIRIYAQLAPGCDPGALARDLEFWDAASWGDGFTFSAGGSYPSFQRVYGPQWPGLLCMNQDWRNTYPPRRRTVYFTAGGPGVAANALNSWQVENYRDGLDELGDIMGGASLLDGCLVLGVGGVGVLRNIKYGKSGLDEDYRLEMKQGAAGCISPFSILSLNGAVVWLSSQGLLVSDGDQIQNLSLRVYSPGDRVGEWSGAIAACEAAARTDGTSDQYVFAVSIVGQKLWVAYTKTGTQYLMAYDFSSSKANAGIAQLLRDDGSPFPWSAPLSLPMSAPGTHTTMGAHVTVAAQGQAAVNVIDNPAHYADGGDGTLAEITGGSPVVAIATFRTDTLETEKKKVPLFVVTQYAKPSDDMALRAKKKGSSNSNLTLVGANVTPFIRKRHELPTKAKSPGDAWTWSIYDSGSGLNSNFWEVEVPYMILDSVR